MYEALDVDNVRKATYLNQTFAKCKNLESEIMLTCCSHRKLAFKNNYNLFLTNH